jgi:hypothetical protein
MLNAFTKEKLVSELQFRYDMFGDSVSRGAMADFA